MARQAMIVGAGVAGLAAAWWLYRSGWQVTVIERADTLRAGGYVMGLSGPGHRVIKQMGLLPAVTQASIPPGRSLYHDSRDRLLMTIEHGAHLHGLDYLVVRRGDLVLTIAQALAQISGQAVNIRYSRHVAAVDHLQDGVRVHLDDGSCDTADLLVVADGVHSTTRSLLWPDGPRALQPLGYRFAAYDVDATAELGGDFLGYVAPGRTAEYYRLAEGRLAALHVWATRERRQPGDSSELANLARLHADDPPLVRDTIAAAQAQGVRPVIDDLMMVEMAPWHCGRAVLLGDAAHCISLISGQGAGMALTGAASLARALAETDNIGAGLVAHEAHLRPAITRLQARSRTIARWFVPRTPLGCTMRNMMVRAMPRPMLKRYFRKAINAELALADVTDA